MIASAALSHRRAPEFAAPEDERVVEQTSLLEILDQRRRRLVHVLRGHRHVLLDVAVMIPRAMVELNHPHATLGEPARHEAVRGETAVARLLDAIAVEDVLRLVAEVGQLRHGRLHAKRHLVLRDARGDFRIDPFRRKHPVQAIDLLHHLTLRALADAIGIADVMHRVALRLELDALKLARQQSARPLPRGDRLRAGLALRREDDEARQTVRLRAQTIEEPRAHARPALDDGPGVHESVRRVVIDLLRLHRADDAQVVRDRLDVRELI